MREMSWFQVFVGSCMAIFLTMSNGCATTMKEAPTTTATHMVNKPDSKIEVAQLTCEQPGENGKIVCHIGAQDITSDGDYQCEIIEGCFPGYRAALHEGQSCLGAVVCDKK